MLTAPTSSTITTGDARTSSRAVDWTAVALVVTALVAVLPFLVRHAAWLWVRPHYGAFPLVLLGSGVLAYVRLREAPGCAGLAKGTGASSPWIAGTWLAACWMVLAAAEVLDSTWLACVATMILIPALAYTLGGRELLRRLLPAWAMLWFLVPPPMDLDRLLILKLQALTTGWSSAVLDAFGVDHLVAGNVIEIDGRKLMVEQACSGINSLFSLLACTLFLVLLTRRGWVRGGLLLVAAVGWVLVANVARVVIVAILETRMGVTAATGWRHEALGIFLFALAVGLLLSTDRFLTFLTRTGTKPATPTETPTEQPASGLTDTESIARTRNGRCARWVVAPAVAAFLLLVCLHWALYESAPDVGGPPAALAPNADLLQAKVGAWERRDFSPQERDANNFFGEHSLVWTYKRPEVAALISLDYPFPQWHDLTWCYRGTGWQIDRQDVHYPPEVPGGYVEVKMSKPGFRHGYLLFCDFDRLGQPFRAREGGVQEPLFRHEATLTRLRDRLAGRPAPAGDPSGAAYQFQLFVEGSAPLSADGMAWVRELFVQTQTCVRSSWAGEKCSQEK
jgi:exosortase